jgi:hypothetical protein
VVPCAPFVAPKNLAINISEPQKKRLSIARFISSQPGTYNIRWSNIPFKNAASISKAYPQDTIEISLPGGFFLELPSLQIMLIGLHDTLDVGKEDAEERLETAGVRYTWEK